MPQPEMPRSLEDTAQDMAETMSLPTLKRMLEFTDKAASEASDREVRGELQKVVRVFDRVYQQRSGPNRDQRKPPRPPTQP